MHICFIVLVHLFENFLSLRTLLFHALPMVPRGDAGSPEEALGCLLLAAQGFLDSDSFPVE